MSNDEKKPNGSVVVTVPTVIDDQSNKDVQKNIYDELTGQFGYWQANVTLFYFIAYILTTFNNLGYVFQSANTDYHCRLSANGSMSFIDDDYEFEITNTSWSTCHLESDCPIRLYNNSINFEYTITSKFELICGKEWLRSFSQSMYQMGYVFSGVIIGWISDQYGRKIALQISIAFELLGGLMLIFSQSIYWYIGARLILGFGDSGRGMCLYMLIMETVGNSRRADIITGCNFGWIVGYLLLPAVAYMLRNYVYVQLVPTMSMALMALVWLPYISESPRWLLAQKRFSQAENVLRKACKINRNETDFETKFAALLKNESINSKSNDEDGKDGNDGKFVNFWTMIINPRFGMITVILWFSFFVNGFIYHGFSLNIEIIGGNVFYNFALAGLIEIPSVIMSLIGMRYVGRKPFIIFTILSATLCYAIIATFRIFQNLSDDDFLLIALTMLGKMFIFATFNAIYIHAGEIFPTKLRQSGVSSCSISARVGSTIAPFIKDLTNTIGLTNTIIMFSSISLASAIGTFFLPETKDRQLIDTFK